eukprot:TRINITY_DN9821_c0_g2_i1.p1 TRINITY_DN9821_c0_g2~~TRINITY_DN9821_c0_g2_i1.p1  ORF type:complete len:461 (-),score=67.66 TRINITY_DN9821_c0_g2_i1:335-1717(-)
MRHLVKVLALSVAIVSRAEIREFRVYTQPITLLPGQVHNTALKPVPLPEDVIRNFANKKMGVVKFQLDIVRFEAGKEISAPLYDLYNHHTLQLMGPAAYMDYFYTQLHTKIPGGTPPHCGSHFTHLTPEGDQLVSKFSLNGATAEVWEGPIGGAEYRNADRDLPPSYRAVVDSPESLLAVLHVINLRNASGPKDWPRLFECPCTSAREIDLRKGTIDGYQPLPFACTDELLAQHNNACKLDWYKGGYRCCENGTFVNEEPRLDAETITFQGKFTIRYDDEPVGADIKHVVSHSLDCSGGNAEYDIPKCNPAEGTVPAEGCVHVVSDVFQVFDNFHPEHFDPVPRFAPLGSTIEILTARGHQHKAGLGMELYDERTGQLICATKPIYGNGTAAGNELGFDVGIPPCVWGPPPLSPPPKFKPWDKVRIVSRYNSTEEHLGVMCFFFLQVAITMPHASGNLVV